MPTRTQTGIFNNEASAVACDGVSALTKNQFCTMLDKTLPRDLTVHFKLAGRARLLNPRPTTDDGRVTCYEPKNGNSKTTDYADDTDGQDF